MLEAVSFIILLYVVGIFISSPYFWWTRTSRDDAPVIRRLKAAGYGVQWPLIAARAVLNSQSMNSSAAASGGQGASASQGAPQAIDTPLVPADIRDRMEQFGRFEFNPAVSRIAAEQVWPDIVSPLYYAAQRAPAEFLRQLADAVVPVGGWAAYGGERLVKEVLSGDLDDPSYHRMMDAALWFLRQNGIPPVKLNSFEQARWNVIRRPGEHWIEPAVAPRLEDARITALDVNGRRIIAQLEASPRSNRFIATRLPNGEYAILIERPFSDDDPRRTERVWRTAPSLHDLYLQLGRSLQVPPFWADDELTPYFPLPSPKIPWLTG